MTSYNDPFPSCNVSCSQAAFLLEPCLFLLFGLIEGRLGTSTGDISVNFTHQKGNQKSSPYLHVGEWCDFYLRLFGYELSTQWNLQWTASCFFLEVGLGDRARPGQWINGGITCGEPWLTASRICDARLRPPFRRIGATSPSAHLLSGCGDSPPPPWRNQSWKDETGEKGRFQNEKRTEKNIDMLSCKLSQKIHWRC